MSSTPASASSPATSAARHPFPFRVEFARQVRRRRTLVIAALLVALPIIVLVAFQVGGNSDGNGGGETRILDAATRSGPNFAVAMLFLSAGFFLVIPIALFFGETVAGEANWSTLRYLLAAPVPRRRLLTTKIAVAFVFSFAAIVLLALVSLLVGTLAYGTGQLNLPTSSPLSYGAATGRIALACVVILLGQLTTAGLALWLSTRTDAPLGAVGGAMGLQIVASILDQVSALGGLREFLPAHWDYAWFDLMQPSIDWTDITKGMSLALSYGLLLFAVAVRGFARKDIVS